MPLLLVAYAVVAAANVLAALLGSDPLELVTKPLLVPLLIAHLLTARGRGAPMVGLTAAGLVCCWLGDLALMGGDAWFLVGLVAFLAGHLGYCAAFAPTWVRNPVRSRPALLAPYVVGWVVLMAVLARDLGGLIAAVAVYGAVLCAMAVLALGVHRLTAVGATLFLVSDGVLAVTALSDRGGFAGDDAVVMATYTLAQLLIVLGVLHAVDERDRRSAMMAG